MSHNFNKDYQTSFDDVQFEKKVREQVRIELGKILAEAQKACDDAAKKGRKQSVDERVAKAREAYSAAFKNPKVDMEVVQELTDALTERVKAKGLYDTAEAAQEDGQKALDFAKALLDGYKFFAISNAPEASSPAGTSELVELLLNDPSLIPNQEKVNYEIYLVTTRFFASLTNDPSLNADLRAQAEEAYNIIVKNSLGVSWYNEDVADWWDSTSKGKFHAMSFQGLKNGITYIDAMNAIRKAHNLNTLGINLKAMAIAILNSQHGGHSEISMVENWANAGRF